MIILYKENEKNSWMLQNNRQAIKRIDKSLYLYGETVIPIDVRNFF